MAVEVFDEEDILSKENLIDEALHKLLRTYDELLRREEDENRFLKNLCSISVETRTWYILLEAGGSQRFTDIFHVAGCSRWKLNKVLKELLTLGLIRMVENRYQAVSPPWLVQFFKTKQRKT